MFYLLLYLSVVCIDLNGICIIYLYTDVVYNLHFFSFSMLNVESIRGISDTFKSFLVLHNVYPFVYCKLQLPCKFN